MGYRCNRSLVLFLRLTLQLLGGPCILHTTGQGRLSNCFSDPACDHRNFHPRHCDKLKLKKIDLDVNQTIKSILVNVGQNVLLSKKMFAMSINFSSYRKTAKSYITPNFLCAKSKTCQKENKYRAWGK